MQCSSLEHIGVVGQKEACTDAERERRPRQRIRGMFATHCFPRRRMMNTSLQHTKALIFSTTPSIRLTVPASWWSWRRVWARKSCAKISCGHRRLDLRAVRTVLGRRRRNASRVLTTFSLPTVIASQTGLHYTARCSEISKFAMPAMSPTMTEGGLAAWKVKEGQSFAAGDVLLEIVSL